MIYQHFQSFYFQCSTIFFFLSNLSHIVSFAIPLFEYCRCRRLQVSFPPNIIMCWCTSETILNLLQVLCCHFTVQSNNTSATPFLLITVSLPYKLSSMQVISTLRTTGLPCHCYTMASKDKDLFSVLLTICFLLLHTRTVNTRDHRGLGGFWSSWNSWNRNLKLSYLLLKLKSEIIILQRWRLSISVEMGNNIPYIN